MTYSEDAENPYASSHAIGHERDTAHRVAGLWKLSLLTCAVAITVAIYNIFRGTENWGPSVPAAALILTVVIILMVGPYIAFGALALALRSNHVLSAILLAIIIAVSLFGTVAFSVETDSYLNRDKSVPGGQRMGFFLLGLAQWIFMIFVSVILLPVFFYLKNLQRKKNPACERSAEHRD